MTTTQPPRQAATSARSEPGGGSRLAGRALAVLRIAFGLTFLWAFFDKLLALGFHTGAVTDNNGTRVGIDFLAEGSAWVNGGHPTAGFLNSSARATPCRVSFTRWRERSGQIGCS